MGIINYITKIFYKPKENIKEPVPETLVPERDYSLLFDKILQDTPVKKVSFNEEKRKEKKIQNIYRINILEYMYLYIVSLWEKLWR